MKVLKWILPVAALGAGVVGTLVLIATRPDVNSEPPPERRPTVETMRVERRPLEHRVRVHGTVWPRTETLLVAEVTGRLVETDEAFVNGGFAEADQMLVKIDPALYEAAVATAEAQLAQAKTLFEREEAESELAHREWKKYGEGEPDPLVLRIPQLAEASAQVKAAEAALRKAQLDLERVEVRAPYRCRIRKRFVEEAQYVTAGTQVAVVYAIDFAEVRLPISPNDLAYLDLPLGSTVAEVTQGPKVTLTARWGAETHEWEAHITRTEGEVDPRTRVVHAIARVQDPYNLEHHTHGVPLLVGTFVEATIVGRHVNDAAVIPRRALRDHDQVFLVDEDSRLRKRSVTVIRREPDRVVVGDGLVSGERICTSFLEVATEGMKVRVVDGPAADAARPRGSPTPDN